MSLIAENEERYQYYNSIYNFAKALLLLSAAVLIIDYFSNKLIDAETTYMPIWIKWVGAICMLFLGAFCNYMPKPVFLLAIVVYFMCFGIWALGIFLTIKIIIQSKLNVATISVLLIMLLKAMLYFYLAKKWWQAFKIIDVLNRLKKSIN